ncbi:hypothetical protein [Pseudonocardia sp. ICBG601]|uniref:hypothetical protein n=1 Tax=Pseudonocardia sp. ICBG601 TaxID=2846759 RepID=UPI001CF6CEB9|nr:hypothetical protein [Pseudonocardia sp. ICBG601]
MSKTRIVDKAGVQIVPEDNRFATELRADLAAALKKATAGLREDVEVKIKVDKDRFAAQTVAATEQLQQAAERLLETEKALEKADRDLVRSNADLEAAEQRHTGVMENLDLATRRQTRAEDDLEQARIEHAGQILKVAELEEYLEARRQDGRGTAFDIANAEQRLEQERDRGWEAAGRQEKAEDALSKARIALSNATAAAMVSETRGYEIRDRAEQSARDYTEALRANEEATRARDAAATDHARATRMEAEELKKAEAESKKYQGNLVRIGTALRKGVTNSRAFTVTQRALRDASSGVRVALDDGEQAAGRYERTLRRTVESVRSVQQRFADVRGSIRTFGDDVDLAGGRFERSFARIRRVGRGVSTDIRNGFSLLGAGARGLSGIVDGLGEHFSGLGISTGLLSKSMTGAIGIFGSFASSLVSAGTQVVKFALIAGAVTYVVGAIGAAAAGLPTLLLGVGAAAVVVALGFDGIKKAYESGLKPALDRLKSQVSDVFEKTLTPAFRKLGTDLLPQITTSVKGMAQAIADGGVALVDLVTKGENVRKINALFTNMTAELRGQLGPALGNLIQSFLDLGASSSIMRDMVGILSDLTNKTADWLSAMNRSGDAARAVSALRQILASLEGVLFSVLTAATNFFTSATPGMTKLFDSIKSGIDKVDFSKLGADFGKVAEAGADLINSIPASTWESIGDSIGRLADKAKELANDQSFQRFVQGALEVVPQLVDGLNNLIGIFDRVAGAVQSVNDFFRPLSDSLDEVASFGGAVTETFNGLPPPVEAAGDAAASAGGKIETGLVPPLQRLPGQAESAFSGVNAAGGRLDPLPGSVAAKAQAAADGVIGGLGPLPDSALQQFQGVNDAAQTGLQPLPETAAAAAAGATEGVQSGLAPAPAAAAEALSGVNDAAKTSLDAATDTARTGADAVASAVGESLQKAPEAAAQSMTGVSDSVRTAMDTATQAATDGATRISEAIGNGMKGASDAATKSMASVADVVEASMQRAGASAEVGGTRIGDGVRTGVEGATTAATDGMNRIADAVQSGMDRAGQAAQSGADRVRTAVQAGLDSAATAAQSAADRIGTAVQQGMDKAASAAQSGAERIRTALTTGFDGATTAVTAAMTRTTQAVTQGMQRCVQVATQGGQQIQQVYTTSFNQVVQIVTSSWQRIVAAFTAGGAQAVASARSTGQQVVAAFQSMAGPMYNAGYTLIQRLTAGMIAAGAAATAAAASIAASIKAQFPSSPAKEGPLSGQGDPLISGGKIATRLATGIGDQAGQVTAVVTSMAARVRGALSAVDPAATLSSSAAAALSGTRIISGAAAATAPRTPVSTSVTSLTTAATTSARTGDPAALIAELKAQTAALHGLRGDALSAGYGPDMLDRLDKLIEAFTADGAGEKTQRLRSRAALGAFG